MDVEDLDNASSAQILRMRLVHIADELAALDADAFAEKHELNLEADELNLEADELRRALKEVEGDQSEALRGWTERAACKVESKTDLELAAEGAVRANGGAGGD